MEYKYSAYTESGKLVAGKVSAVSDEAAADILDFAGYRLVSLKPYTPFLPVDKLLAYFSRTSSKEVISFSRQLAILLESGTDIVTSLQLIQSQVTNKQMKGTVGAVVNDIRGGSPLSAALGKHPRIFPPIFSRAIIAGEQGGNLELVLRQMADYLERAIETRKKIKNATTYPLITVVVAVIAIIILITFVFPKFVEIYSALGVELPLATRLLIAVTNWFSDYGVYVLLAIVVAIVLGFAYVKTPKGKDWFDALLLRIPIIGYILLLTENSRLCRIMSMLFRIGLPLTEIMALVIKSTNNNAFIKAINVVRQKTMRGEGISQPMLKSNLFLPLMIQMISVGEETGSLDKTLTIVAESYELESSDRINTAIGLIQPAMVIVIGLAIGFIAFSLISAMYSMYGQVGF